MNDRAHTTSPSQDEVTRLRQRVTELEAPLAARDSGIAERLVYSLGVIFWEADPTTEQFTFVSPQAENITGYPPEAWYANDFWLERMHPEDREWAPAHCREMASRGEPTDFHYRFLAADGSILWMRDIVTVEMRDGQPIRKRGVMVDVTEQVRAAESLRVSERRLRLIQEQLPAVMWTTDRDLRFTSSHGAALQTIDLTPQQVVGMALRDYFGDSDISDTVHAHHARALRGERSQFTVQWMSRYFECAAEPLRNSREQIIGVVGIALDITERHEILQRLEENERFLKTLISHLPGYVYRCGYEPTWTLTFVSKGAEALTGYPVDRLIGPNAAGFNELIEPEDLEEVWRVVSEAVEHNRPFQTTYRIRHADGSIRWVWERGQAIRDADGSVIALEGFVSDVTELRRSEEALAAQARRQQATAELGMLALSDADLDTLMTEVARRTAEALNAEFTTVLELLPGGDEFLFRAGVGWREGLVGATRIRTGPGSQAGYTLDVQEPVIVEDLYTETRFSKPDLLVEHGVVSGMSTIVGGGATPFGVLSVHTRSRRSFTADDVNFLRAIANILAMAIEHRRVNSELRRREREFKALVEHTPDIIARFDRELRQIYVNPAIKTFTGVPPEQLVGRHISELPMSESLTRNWARNLRAVMRTGREQVIEFENHTALNHLMVLEARLVPEYNDQGEIESVLAIGRNITQRKRVEAELRQANKRQRLLLRELDHRVRNNLASLAALIDITSRRVSTTEDFAISIRGRVQAMSAVHGLLSKGHWTVIDLRDLLLALIPNDLALQFSIQGPVVAVAATQGAALGMVLQELVANSLKYGALKHADGRVEVTWRHLAESGTDYTPIEMTWREGHGPPAGAAVRPGLGTELIRGLVRAELRGEADLAFSPEGVFHRLVMRLERPATETRQGDSATT